MKISGEFIKIERGSEFINAAKELSEFMRSLQLSEDQHKRLLDLTIAQVLAAERNAFGEGMRLGREYGIYETTLS